MHKTVMSIKHFCILLCYKDFHRNTVDIPGEPRYCHFGVSKVNYSDSDCLKVATVSKPSNNVQL